MTRACSHTSYGDRWALHGPIASDAEGHAVLLAILLIFPFMIHNSVSLLVTFQLSISWKKFKALNFSWDRQLKSNQEWYWPCCPYFGGERDFWAVCRSVKQCAACPAVCFMHQLVHNWPNRDKSKPRYLFNMHWLYRLLGSICLKWNYTVITYFIM